MLIYHASKQDRCAHAQHPKTAAHPVELPAALTRKSPLGLPNVSELDAVRHYTNLSKLNFGIDTHFYPLGSCTMKYNPRGVNKIASLPGFLNRHPLAHASLSQGVLSVLYDLQTTLAEVTGMDAVSLTPMAGAQGELAGCAMIKAYHAARNQPERTEMLIPDAAHGTNPATARMCGFTVKEIPTNDQGDVDVDALKAAVGPNTAGIMLTNPSTLGVFERQIETIAKIVHEAGGLLYYDGANLNAILGKVRPGDMGFDVMHMNLHKTFATPHGGGGPGAGPVAAGPRLAPYLPAPMVKKTDTGFAWTTSADTPETIGRLSCFMGNTSMLVRAYAYARMLGKDGLHRVAEFATLNANYLLARLKEAGIELAFPERRATHEFIVTFQAIQKATGITAMDLAKRLLDYKFHAPTTYFPLLVPECWLIEPTETESKETLDAFVDALLSILDEAKTNPDLVKTAPHTCPVKRLNEVHAAKVLDVAVEYEG